jgi:hypothetical protein
MLKDRRSTLFKPPSILHESRVNQFPQTLHPGNKLSRAVARATHEVNGLSISEQIAADGRA